MIYGKVHRFMLRTIASNGVVKLSDANNILSSLTDGDEELSVYDIIKDINNEIKPYEQSIKITKDELSNEDVIVFLSLGYDDATKAQNVFNATELEFFRLLIEQIMTTESRQITGIHALNLVGGMKSSFTKVDAQKLLNRWCKMYYLDKDKENYALGVRAIHEFEGYLRTNMPDTIEECSLCKQIVFRGCNCIACGLAIHTNCLNKYLEKVNKWPCCKTEFDASQLERLHNEETISQMNQSESSQVTQMENTQIIPTQETMVEIQPEDIIPEISQRVVRKRKRNCE